MNGLLREGSLRTKVTKAVLALTDNAVCGCYYLESQLRSEGKDPHNWGSFEVGMLKLYADLAPDLHVRGESSALKQTTLVQEYHNEFRRLVFTAVRYPIKGAKPVYFFKKGLKDKMKTMMALDSVKLSDNDLDTYVKNCIACDDVTTTIVTDDEPRGCGVSRDPQRGAQPSPAPTHKKAAVSSDGQIPQGHIDYRRAHHKSQRIHCLVPLDLVPT